MWRIAYFDENGERHQIAGFRSKSETLELANKIEQDIKRAKHGLPAAANANLLKTVDEAIEEYLGELKRLGRSKSHLANERGFLARLAFACNWNVLGNLRESHLLAYLAKLHDEGKSPRTQNAYRDAASAFAGFLVRRKWLPENMFRAVPKAKLAGRRPRQRRAFTQEEFSKLAAVHPQRGPVYQVAGLSGLRREELTLLECQDFVLGDSPQWRVRGEITKGKRYEIVPMLPECAEILARICAGKAATDRVFASVPIPRTFNLDLTRAGIKKRDERGRQADFHGLRYFFCTLAGRKLAIQVVRALMRHRDIRTTCNLYMDLGIEDVAQAAWKLPRLLVYGCD